MKINLRSLLLAFVCIAGLQSFCQAQMTVTNQAACKIYVYAIQEDMNTAQRCDMCNISARTTILPGATVVFSRDIACGRHVWNQIAWSTNLNGSSSSSWNPVYQNTCSFDVFNSTCSAGGSALTATWVQSGAGPVQVVIN